MNRTSLFLKLLTQLGVKPLLLFALYRLGLHSGHYRRLDARMQSDAARAGPLRQILPLPAHDALLAGLNRQARAIIRRDADSVVRSRIRLFGDRLVPLQLAPRGPLRHWVDYARDPSLLASLSLPHGDVKFLWEPARFGWAYTLGRAFLLSGLDRYAIAFWKQFEQFERSNPAYLGPHWMNGQEVAIRLMALLWAAQAFAPARASTPRRLRRLTRSIALHAARIPPTLVYARSQNNNHLVTEATALFLAGSAMEHLRWQALGWKWLSRALQSQVGSYGEYVQHSANYHRLMLQSALLAEVVRRPSGRLWPSRTQDALARASHWLFSMLDPVSGRVPNLGSNDGSLILPLSACSHADFRPTVQAAARAFLRTSLPPGDYDDLGLWLGLRPLEHTADPAAYAAEHLRNRDAWAYLRASSWKSRLSHMDQLHVDLWWRGVNIAADAGTYLYNGPAPWDNSLVSSQVHNCISIDGREQMTRGGRFLVLDWFPAHSQPVLSPRLPVAQQVRASHRGFAKLGLRYERILSLTESGGWGIQDALHFTRRDRHSVRLHWLLRDGLWHMEQNANVVRLRLRLPAGYLTVSVAAAGGFDSPLRASLVRGGRLLRGDRFPHPWEGWISPTYGRKQPALSFVVEAEAVADCSFNTEFLFPG
jgi:hypothetical protein